jgi:uncharacterized phiE125 gp8 family phage protein
MPVLEKVSGPSVEPVTLAEAKAHLRIDSTDEDTLVGYLVAAAREYIEEQTRLSLVATRWRYRLEGFPEDNGDIELPRRPMILSTNANKSLSSPVVRYWQGTEVEEIFLLDQTDGDFLAATGTPPTVRLYNAWFWPFLTTWRPLPVEIEYTAGYGVDGTNVPRPLKLAILLLVGHWYMNREAASNEAGLPIPFSVENILRLWDSGEYK